MEKQKIKTGIPLDKMEELREPFEDFAYDDASYGAKQMTSIKAIYAFERMNKVFGAGRWEVVWELVPEFCRMTDKGKFEVVVKGKIVLHDYPDFHGTETMAGNDSNSWTDAAKGAVTSLTSKLTSFIEIGLDVFQGKVRVQGKGPGKKVIRNGESIDNGQQQPQTPAKPKPKTETITLESLEFKHLKAGKWNMDFHQKGNNYFIWLYGKDGTAKEVKLTPEQKETCMEYAMDNAETPANLPPMDGDFAQKKLAV